MRCLVTGGAGFIGSHIVHALIRRGDDVRVLDNFSTGSKANLGDALGKIDLVQGDLRNLTDLHKAVKDVQVIFHQAALRSVPRSVDDPLSSDQVNTGGSLQLLWAAKKAGIKRVVYASSSSVYGDNREFPQHEGLRTSPLSPYAVSKLAAENYCAVFAKTFGLETVALRYFNVFGPRQHPESQYAAVVPKFIRAATDGAALEVHGDGRQSRDFTFIDNVVQANLRAAAAAGVSGHAFNIACGQSHSLLQIIRVLEKLSGRRLERRHVPPRAGDVRKTWADIRKAKRLLGYRPGIDLAEGLKRTWEWFAE